MIGYSERTIFDSDLVRFYYRATELVASLAEPISIDDIRCHELVRALHKVLGLGFIFEVVDGKYGVVDHSWLAYRRGRSILDVYTVGRAPMVQLIEMSALLPESQAYKPNILREDIREERVLELVEFFKSR